MRRKCDTCLCRTCLKACRCADCQGKVEACGNYRGFHQLDIFRQDAKRYMRILVACEESQRVCTEFRRLGHEAWSCDIEPCSGGHPEWHIQADVLPLLGGDCGFRTADGTGHWVYGKWDMIIAFPPCTHLAVSGAKHFAQKRRDGRQQQGIDFFMKFVDADCERIAIENPVGIMSGLYRKPDQIIQPYEFGDPFEKRTCLWLKNLSPLVPTKVVQPPERQKLPGGHTIPAWYSKGGRDRQKNRSKTFPGIAAAMAEQWGVVDDTSIQKCQSVPRHSLSYYGLTYKRVEELERLIRSGKYATVALQAAHKADNDAAEYILLSIMKKLSYEGLDKLYGRGEIDRVPCSRTGFYYTKKYFYSIFDKELRRIGK